MENIYFQKSYEPKRETSKSKKCEILEDSLHRVTLSAPEKKDTKWVIKKNVAIYCSGGIVLYEQIQKMLFFESFASAMIVRHSQYPRDDCPTKI